jgi:hypothetical protein
LAIAYRNGMSLEDSVMVGTHVARGRCIHLAM